MASGGTMILQDQAKKKKKTPLQHVTYVVLQYMFCYWYPGKKDEETIPEK